MRAEPVPTRRPSICAGWPAVLSLGVVLAVLRAPSLIEPAQFSDEGTYADIGWALDHGASLYRTVWDNKPPGLYWLAAAIDVAHPSVLAFHVVATLLAVAATVGVWFLGRRLASDRVAWIAAFSFAVVSSLPTLGGDVLNAEQVGAALVLGAGLLVFIPGRAPTLRLLLAGGAVGCALLCKATFVADAIAIGTVPMWIAGDTGRRAAMRTMRMTVIFAMGATAVVATALLALSLTGSVGGLVDVLFRQDLAYVQAAAVGSGAGTVASPPNDGAVLALLTIARIAVVLGAGLAGALVLARRRRGAMAAVVWWLAWDAAAAMLSARGLTHYAQQMEPVLCIAAALVVDALWRNWHSAIALGVSAAVGAWAVSTAVVIIPTVEASLIVHEPLGSFVAAVISPRSLTHYVARGWERLLGMESRATFEAGFGDEPARLAAAVAVIDAHSGAGDAVFVWGALPWVYALSERLPAGEYVTLDDAYAIDASAQPRLIAELRAHPPAVFVALTALPAQVTSLLADDGYTESVPASGQRFWIASGH